MIDAEKLLGKVLAGAAQGVTGKKRKKGDDLIGGLLGGLTSGKGLVTVIGLGVGAYEILKQQSTGSPSGASVPPAPPSQPAGSASPPLLPVKQQSSPPPLSGAVTSPPAVEKPQQADNQDLAVKLNISENVKRFIEAEL